MTQFKKTITTIFWVGEGATEENGYIHNRSSYWDDNWMKHFGGVDSPLNRKGWLPAAFTPKQNPFYVALPFAEVDGDGNLKEIAKKIPGFGQNAGPLTRNRWVEIRYKGRFRLGFRFREEAEKQVGAEGRSRYFARKRTVPRHR